ncbi:MAG TPA: DUF6036 family nucleotidyltransferase [Ktedonobacteraceae bacterium]|jgi:uncharacterized nucleotidyltransferase DUF6036|nr:DUF6036 family nucleotidyltransferase [Ktedonobacteraceae bacterium]
MSTALKTQFDSSWNEADQLISILRRWGITYLVGEGTPIHPSDMATNQASAVRLIKRLAQCEYPRVRDAMISLFLLHPRLADAALEALKTSTPATAEQIATLLLATLYLQRMWSIRLALALGHAPDFPEELFAHLWQRRHLPPPAYHDGEWGLTKLQEYEQRQSGLPLNYLRDWQNQVDHLLLQEEFYHCTPTFPVMQLLEDRKDDEQEPEMSMRPNVDKGQIENFLRNLGRTFRRPGRLYLVGGAALVHMGIRSGSTQDIDVEIRATNEDEMMEAIRHLKDTMNINIEFASPGDFMPLPKQWEMHAKYIGRYGTIEAFYFDFYSIALSKIQRGSTGDIRDVKLLLEQGIITLPELDEAYNEVLPQVGKRPYGRLDPKQFAERYATIRQLFSPSDV